MAMSNTISYRGYSFSRYQGYLRAVWMAAQQHGYPHIQVPLTVACENMQDESDEGYTLRQHSLSRIQPQTPPVYAWLDRHGYSSPTEYKLWRQI